MTGPCWLHRCLLPHPNLPSIRFVCTCLSVSLPAPFRRPPRRRTAGPPLAHINFSEAPEWCVHQRSPPCLHTALVHSSHCETRLPNSPVLVHPAPPAGSRPLPFPGTPPMPGVIYETHGLVSGISKHSNLSAMLGGGRAGCESALTGAPCSVTRQAAGAGGRLGGLPRHAASVWRHSRVRRTRMRLASMLHRAAAPHPT